MNLPSQKAGSRDAYERWLRDRHQPAHARRTADRNAAFLLPHLRAGMRLIDAGCGPGSITTGLAEVVAPGETVGIDASPDAVESARAHAREKGADGVRFEVADVYALPFDDASFDHVISSLVLCTVRDQARALGEARRVLKPGGTLRFLEHVRNDESGFWGTVQDAITPVWRWLGAGCHPNRRTQQAIEAAGFRIEWLEQVRIAPGTPAIYGVARRA